MPLAPRDSRGAVLLSAASVVRPKMRKRGSQLTPIPIPVPVPVLNLECSHPRGRLQAQRLRAASLQPADQDRHCIKEYLR